MKIIICADKGKWLTDGENYGKTISLAEGVTVDEYYEITDEEYQERMKENEIELTGAENGEEY